ncbi:hypothetical protein [Streptomyces kanamyceticus]|uniref:Uncharacterized protein n=1 Tax=Streptomyces kanamyceticus TaxID=1967 RepID=A0A5J6GG11_STRKN|nr:hypothetical protein [Streptomyces kanamyceticus]QEU92901.1 hypothetical protein CP970_20090 [Streptomyces kanamyceticus]
MSPRIRDRFKRPTRRTVLTVGGVATVAGLGWGANWLSVYNSHERSNVGKLGFRNPLRIPELLDPAASRDGSRRYELNLISGKSQFLPGKQTATWGAMRGPKDTVWPTRTPE